MRYRCTKCYNFINRYARDKNGIETQGICQKCWESAGIIELAEPNKKEFIYTPTKEATTDMPIEEQIQIEINKAIEDLRFKFPQYLFCIDYWEYHIDTTPSNPVVLKD